LHVLRGPTLEMLSADRAHLALLGIHHGFAIRWKEWKDDARLADGRVLLEWLAERGVSEPLRDFEEAQTRKRQRHTAWNRWVEAMPADLRALPEAMWQELTTSGDLTAVLTATADSCPDARERILALFKWYGSGAGSWSQYPDWERFPERLLLTFSQADLVNAASGPLTEAQLDGAARLFAGRDFQAHSEQRDTTGSLSIWYSEMDVFEAERSAEGPASLPDALLRRLWDHCQKSDDPDKRQRGDSAFCGPRDHANGHEANPG
jgi:hypothetical protein